MRCESTEIYRARLPIFTVMPASIYLFRSRVFIRLCAPKEVPRENMDLYSAGFIRCNVTTDARVRVDDDGASGARRL